MSDPIAQAAEALSAAPSSTEPVQGSGVIVNGVGIPASAVSGTTITLENAPVTGNVLVNAGPMVDAPNVVNTSGAGEITGASDVAPSDLPPETAALPRESHLMLLEHKLAAMHAKFKTGERIVIDEFEQILGHIRAVL